MAGFVTSESGFESISKIVDALGCKLTITSHL